MQCIVEASLRMFYSVAEIAMGICYKDRKEKGNRHSAPNHIGEGPNQGTFTTKAYCYK